MRYLWKPFWRTLIVLVALVGCNRTPRPAPSDQAVLDALFRYEPKYELDNNGRVMSLTINGRRIEHSSALEIRKLTELRNLDLYGVTISTNSLEALCGLDRLEGLGLGATNITDDGLEHLKGLPSLQWLWLPSKGISEAKVAALKEALPGLTVYRQ
jgi:hypothetical protein